MFALFSSPTLILMVEEIGSLVTLLNSMSPLAIIALLAFVLFYQAKNNKASVQHTTTLDTIKGNDLHELPEMAENIRELTATMQRMETSNAANFATIIAKLTRSR